MVYTGTLYSSTAEQHQTKSILTRSGYTHLYYSWPTPDQVQSWHALVTPVLQLTNTKSSPDTLWLHTPVLQLTNTKSSPDTLWLHLYNSWPTPSPVLTLSGYTHLHYSWPTPDQVKSWHAVVTHLYYSRNQLPHHGWDMIKDKINFDADIPPHWEQCANSTLSTNWKQKQINAWQSQYIQNI